MVFWGESDTNFPSCPPAVADTTATGAKEPPVTDTRDKSNQGSKALRSVTVFSPLITDSMNTHAPILLATGESLGSTAAAVECGDGSPTRAALYIGDPAFRTARAEVGASTCRSPATPSKAPSLKSRVFSTADDSRMNSSQCDLNALLS